MAEAPDRIDKRLEELEDEITCAVCQGHYQEARLLPCNHYYCRACIEELAKRSRGRPFPCPECRRDTTLSPGGAEQLQSAFFVERLKDLYGRMAKAEGKMEAVCEMCPAGKAVAFCRHCVQFLCSDCTRSHQRMTMFDGHSVSTLEDLKKSRAKDIPLKEAPPSKCPEHDDQIMTIFCFDCNSLICRDCTVIDHNGHKFNFLKKCAAESRTSLRNSLTPLRKVQANITDTDKKLVVTEAQVDAQQKKVCQAIKRSFAQLKAVLEQREMELLNKAATLAREKKDALTAQRKGLQMAETEIQSLVEFVEKNVENTSDKNLMVICTQLQARVEEEEKRHRLLSLEPATTANITFYPTSHDIIPRDLGVVAVTSNAAVTKPPPAPLDVGRMPSPMENMSQQHGDQCNQLIMEYEEMMTNPGVLGQLEEEFADPFDADVVLGKIFMAAYEKSKNCVLELVVDNLKQLFTVQTELDDQAGSSSYMSDLSHAFGLLLHSTAARSRLMCSTIIPCICDKIKYEIPHLDPRKRVKIKTPELLVKQVVDLTWKFVTLPSPIIVCQPQAYDPRIHERSCHHWRKRTMPCQLFYARPVVYRSYHGVLASKGLIGNI